jgi:hypothetical protein
VRNLYTKVNEISDQMTKDHDSKLHEETVSERFPIICHYPKQGRRWSFPFTPTNFCVPSNSPSRSKCIREIQKNVSPSPARRKDAPLKQCKKWDIIS